VVTCWEVFICFASPKLQYLPLIINHVGGIGFFSPERGWSCDSVVNFEIVLSSGIIANANATSNANLFVALKGGLNNFGIVTRFDLEIFEQGPMWGGVIIYPNSSDEALLDTLTAVKNPEQFDPHAIFTFGFLYDTVTRQFTADIAMYHSRPEKVNGSSLESFANIQPQLLNTMRIGSPGGFASETFGPVVQKHS
jgi:FAD/FMN-containing dehydrogenase